MDLPLQTTTIFQNAAIPAGTHLVGMSALVEAFKIHAPVRYPASISQQNIKGHSKTQGPWRIYSKRYQPESTIEAHLDFAMHYEQIDLLVLKRVFLALPPKAVAQYIASAPVSIYSRRAWYLYELLTENRLDVPDAPMVKAVDLLDTEKYFTKPIGKLSQRHRVRDNLLGTVRFCPIIRRTEALRNFISLDLSKSALKTIGLVSKAVIARAASFLLLADSQASFQIEGERPARDRIERWGRAMMQAGKHPLTEVELVRLHKILIEDNRFVQPGLRKEGVFLGERSAEGDPLPEFIGARPDILTGMLEALIETNTIMREASLDGVLQAAATAFGFVYLHPFEDGNGRLHRLLIHHTLADRSFTPPGMLFPVSTVILDWIDLYRDTLKSHSAPLMEFINWNQTQKGNVEVTNDTDDLYRYFDCTEAAEFLYLCVRRTIEEDLPREIDYLTRRDEALRNVMNLVEMPDRMAEQLVLYIHRNEGRFPKKRREEFAALTDEEIEKLERIVQDAFEGFQKGTSQSS